MQIQPLFPEDRRQEVKRRAEATVYDLIANSALRGRTMYELKLNGPTPETDLFIGLDDGAYINGQIKGGHYAYQKNPSAWFLATPDGSKPTQSPIYQTQQPAVEISKLVRAELKEVIFVVPVLIFPDMAADPDIEYQVAEKAHRLHIIWGIENLPGRLAAIAEAEDIYYRPTAAQIQKVFAWLAGQQIRWNKADLNYTEADEVAVVEQEPVDVGSRPIIIRKGMGAKFSWDPEGNLLITKA